MRSSCCRCALLAVMFVSPALSAAAQDEEPAAVAAPRPLVEPVLPPLVTVTRTLHVDLAPNRVRCTARLEFTVRRGTIRQVRFTLPPHDALDLTASGGKLRTWSVSADENPPAVTVELARPVRDRLTLHVATEAPRTEADVQLDGTAFQPLDTFRDRGLVIVTHDPALTLHATSNQLRRVVPEILPAADRRPGAACFRFDEPTFAVTLSTTPAELHGTATAETRIDLHGDEAAVTSHLHCTIAPPGTVELRLQLPESFELDTLQCTGLHDQQTAADGTLLLFLDSRRHGTVDVTVNGRCPPAAAQADPQPVRPVALPITGGTREIRNLCPPKVTASLHDADPLRDNIAGEREETGETSDAPGTSAVPSRSDRSPLGEDAESSPLVVERGAVEVVLGRGEWTPARAWYRLATTGRDRLEVQLPAGAEVWDARLDGRPVRLIATDAAADAEWRGYAVELSDADRGKGALLSLAWRIPADPAAMQGRRGRAVLPLPRLGSETPALVRPMRVAVWMPDDYELIDSPRGFARMSSMEPLAAWIGGTASGSDLPTAGRRWLFHQTGAADEIELRYWNGGMVAWLLGGAAVVIALLLRPTAWGNRLTMLLLLALAAVALARLDAAAVWQGVRAARWGLAAAAGLWLLDPLHHAWRHHRTALDAPAAAAPVRRQRAA